MTILIVSPRLNPHGGTRVLAEWANGLKALGHHVVFQVTDAAENTSWVTLRSDIFTIQSKDVDPRPYDVVIASTPPIATALRNFDNVVYLLQMAEELFSPWDQNWVHTCQNSYFLGHPIITCSRWVEYRLRNMGVNTPIFYVGNGGRFGKLEVPKETEPCILVPNWESYNSAKDIHNLAPKCARYLKQKHGVRVLTFSNLPAATLVKVPDEYYVAISERDIEILNKRSWFSVQSSRFDAWSLSGMEALFNGRTLARAIVAGDDYLVHMRNCLRGGYDLDELIYNAERLLEDETLRDNLANTEDLLTWDEQCKIIERILDDICN